MKLSTVAEVRLGRQRSPERATGPSMRPYMRAANVTWKGISLHDVKEMDFTDSEFGIYQLKPMDILLSEASGSASEVGKPALWRGELPNTCFQNTLIRVRSYDPECVPYLHWHFFNDALSQGFAKASRGVGIHHIGAKTMEQWTIRLAPLPEQHRIVAEIEKHFPRLDDAVATLKRVQASLKQARTSVLKAAVEGRLVPTEAELARAEGRTYEPASVLLERILAERKRKHETNGKKFKPPIGPAANRLPELREGWVWTSLGQAFSVHVGATPSRSNPTFWGGRIPWVSSGEVQFCRIHHTRETITEDGLASASTSVHPPGTVLLGMIGQGRTRGQSAILDVAACNNQNAAAIRVSETPILPEFVYYYLWARYEETRRLGSGNNQQALNKSRVEQIEMALPPFAEQRRIVAEVERRLSVLDALDQTIRLNLSRCNHLRQSILKRAFSGKLVPQDPTDEPASALLARIRTPANP